MTIIVSGHGEAPDEDYTFVPLGQTVRTYTADTVTLTSNVALLALLDGAGQAGRRIAGPNRIRNYQLTKEDDQFLAQWAALAVESDVRIVGVGVEPDIPDIIRLCGHDNPGRVTISCSEQGEHTCFDGRYFGRKRKLGEEFVREDISPHAVPRVVTEPRCERLGRHICSGMLGYLPPEKWNDIALVACLGEAATIPGPFGNRPGKAYDDDWDNPELHVDTEYDFTVAQLEGAPPLRNPDTCSTGADSAGAVPDNPDDSPMKYVWRRIMKRPADRVAIAEAEAYVDRLPEATLALLISYVDISCWLRARWIKSYAEQDKLDQVVGQLAANVPQLDGIMTWLNDVPWYGEAFNQACDSRNQKRLVRELVKYGLATNSEVLNAIRTRPRTSSSNAQSGMPDWEVAEVVYQSARFGDLDSVFMMLRGRVDVVAGVLGQLVARPGYGQALDAAAQQNIEQFWELFSYADLEVQLALLGRAVLCELIDQHLWTLLTTGDTVQAETGWDALPDRTRDTLYLNSNWLGRWQHVRIIVYYAQNDAIQALFETLQQHSGGYDEILDLIDTIPAYRQALNDAAARNANTFTAYVDDFPDESIRHQLQESFRWARPDDFESFP
ncbi:putative adhesin [Amycolatopsis sp. SID8362]|uniref:putative adhesin n=1 Tax=Amycolatopsis sp. SID8362 TaxID=2690346 RepID=UPI00136F6E28|nr:hypothetical protein [Amycolatopsis sp. SID8362]NBH10388.1 hypothetical protein [Amycolatopsis sp. SID8362]NED47083.1 hypothetical protein [Amycolatopsis sp. SID8362]